MHISISQEMAIRFGGVDAALLLQNFFFWININKKNKRHFYDNRYWTYGSVKDLQEKYPFLSTNKIRYTLNRLVKEGILVKGNYNRHKYDRTLWYAFSSKEVYSEIFHLLKTQMDFEKKDNASENSAQPIQDTKRNLKNKEEASSHVDDSLASELCSRGLTKKQSAKLLNNLSEDFIRDKIDQFDFIEKYRSYKIKNRGQYLYCSIRDNWEDEEYLDYISRKKRNTTNNEPPKPIGEGDIDNDLRVLNYFNNLPDVRQQEIRRNILKKLERKSLYSQNSDLTKASMQSYIVSYISTHIPDFQTV